MPLGNIGDQFEYYQNVNLKDNTLQVGGVGTKPQETITRQANTTQYNITDVLLSGGSSMLQFNVLQSAGKSSWAIGGRATHSVSATTEPNIDLHLFCSGFTISADNSEFRPNNNELLHYIGTISFSTWKIFGNSSYSDGSVETPILLKSLNSTNNLIYGVPVLRNTYTPASSEIFSFSLDTEQH